MKLVIGVLVAASLAIPAAAPAAEPFFYTDAIARGRTLDVRDVNGDVTVVPGERLEVRATKTARRGNPDDVKIVTERVASGIVVCVRYPGEEPACDRARDGGRNSSGNDTTVDFAIRVPSGVNVSAASINGIVDVRSDATVAARTVNGRLTIDAGDISRATTVNGSIDARLRNAASSAPLRIATVNGSVTCTVPQGAGLHVHASVLNGSIDAGGITVNRPAYGPGASADGTLGDGRRQLDLRALNGSIRLVRS